MDIFQSHHLNAGEYNPSTGIATIQFVNGAIYQYRISQQTYNELKSSSSPGDYFHDHVKPKMVSKLVDGVKKGRRR